MAEQAETSLFPFDLPDRTVVGIRGVSFRTAAAAALGFRVRGESVIPERAAAEVMVMIDRIVERSNFGLLPVGFDDEESLSSLSGGKVKPGTRYPQQTGLLVARAGFETFVAAANAMPAPSVENIIVTTCAAASAHWYLQLGNTGKEETDAASQYVARQVGEALRTPDPAKFIEETVTRIKTGDISFSGDGKNPPSDLFTGSIKMALQITGLTIAEMNAPSLQLSPPPRDGSMNSLAHYRHRNGHTRHQRYH